LLFLIIYKLQVYDFLVYFPNKQPDGGYVVAETCSCYL